MSFREKMVAVVGCVLAFSLGILAPQSTSVRPVSVGALGRGHRRRLALLIALALGCLTMTGGASTAQGEIGGVWMLRNPGCGAQLLAHQPTSVSLTCDPVAWVEKIDWKGWGASRARASGTLNLADLSHGTSVAAAPRLRFAATIVASDVKPCGSKHVYWHVRIYYHDKGKRRVASLPPPFECPKKEAEGAGLEEFSSPDGHVLCFIDGSPPGVGCYAYLSELQGTQDSATLDGRGKVSICSSAFPGCFQHWFAPPMLGYGQWTEAGGIRCSSSQAGITCIKVSGVGKGHGFRINKEEAVEVGA
jgi:hypothetical protein